MAGAVRVSCSRSDLFGLKKTAVLGRLPLLGTAHDDSNDGDAAAVETAKVIFVLHGPSRLGASLAPKGETVAKTDMHRLEFHDPPRHRAKPDARSLALASHRRNRLCGQKRTI
jgi:hypothetical protein